MRKNRGLDLIHVHLFLDTMSGCPWGCGELTPHPLSIQPNSFPSGSIENTVSVYSNSTIWDRILTSNGESFSTITDGALTSCLKI